MNQIVVTILIITSNLSVIAQNNEGQVFKDLGKQAYNNGDYYLSLKYYNQALDFFIDDNNSLQKSKVQSNIGAVYSSAGYHSMSLRLYSDALESAFEAKNHKSLAITYYNIGSSFLELNLTSSACEYLQYSDSLFEKIGNTSYKSWIQNQIGRSYRIDSLYEDARWYYEQSLKSNTSVSRTGMLWNNIGFTYLLELDSIKANQAFSSALLLLPHMNPYDKEVLLTNLALVSTNQDQKLAYIKTSINSVSWINKLNTEAVFDIINHYIGKDDDSVRCYVKLQQDFALKSLEQQQFLESEFKKYQIKSAHAESNAQHQAFIANNQILLKWLISGGAIALMIIFGIVYYNKRKTLEDDIDNNRFVI